MANLPKEGTITKHSFEDVEAGKGILMDVVGEDESKTKIGFIISKSKENEIYVGTITAVQVLEAEDGDSKWWFLHLMSMMGMTFEAEVDIPNKTLKLTEDL